MSVSFCHVSEIRHVGSAMSGTSRGRETRASSPYDMTNRFSEPAWTMNPEAYLEMADTEARHWWFAGRRAILASLIQRFELRADARILEIGAGTGGNLPMLSSFGKVSALEMDDAARAIAIEKTGRRFDIRSGCCPANIPFMDERFDLICLFDVLEHIDDDSGTLAAIKTMMTAQARVLVTVSAYRWLWSTHDEFLHHKRR